MLRLDEKGRKVLGIEWMPHRAEHLAAVGQHYCSGIALKGVAKGIICSEKKPSVAAGLYNCRSRAMRKHPGIVGPVNCVW